MSAATVRTAPAHSCSPTARRTLGIFGLTAVLLGGCGDDATGTGTDTDGSGTSASATDGPSGGSTPTQGSLDDSGSGGMGSGSDDSDPSATDDTGGPPQTCANEVQDPDEEGVDCGGPCPTCPGVAFDDEPTPWPVPALTFFGTTDTFDLQWTSMDIDGDGLPDLVHTHDGSFTAHGDGTDPHWLVHRNEGDGFADAATPWPVPDLLFFGTTDTFDLQWISLDIDGDGLPDLVHTHDGSFTAHGDAMDPHWLVYFNEGNGFSAVASPWPVPDLQFFGATDTFDLQWTSMDIDGDGLSDLVHTHDGSFTAHGDAADPHWQVYGNEGNGFAAAAASWSVPGTQFFGATDSFDLQWISLDLDGDDRVDLVHTHDGSFTAHGGAADPHWQVYVNDGSGFDDAASSWSVPDAQFFGASDFFDLQWTSLDIDGAGAIDLVHTHDGSFTAHGDAADPHWLVYTNEGSGFAAGATSWSVPSTQFFGTTDSFDLQWTSLDIDGNGRTDLVSTHDGSFTAHGDAADPHWLVYFNISG